MFGHLQVKSAYSFQQSTILLKDLVVDAKKKNIQALTLVDNNMFGALEFSELCLKNNIKPIFGLEAHLIFEGEMSPFILIARNTVGYFALVKISSLIQCSKEKRIPFETIIDYKESLYIFSGHPEGIIEREISKELRQEYIRHVKEFKSIFGDSYMFMVHNHGIEHQNYVQKTMIELGKQENIKIVCSNDVCYLKEDQAIALELLEASAKGLTINLNEKLVTTQKYLKTEDEMKKLFSADIINQTALIIEECQATIPMNDQDLPVYQTPQGVQSPQYLSSLCVTGLKKRFKGQQIERVYIERLKYELDIIHQMKFDDYFLIVYDYVRYAKVNKIQVGPGRGSAAGSLVAYVLGITNVDPIEYDLLFERFLNPERISMPDIDIDFQDDRRDEVVQYVIDKYGHEHVAQIVTFSTYGPRVAIKDMGKVIGLPLARLEILAKMVPTSPKNKKTITEMYSSSAQFQNFIHSDMGLQRIIPALSLIEHLPRNISTHAAGVILSKEKLSDVIPVVNGPSSSFMSQYSKDYVEKIGLLKMDFLGLKNLTMLDYMVKDIERETGQVIKLNEIPLDNQKAYELISRGETFGIFQLESQGMRNLLMKMKPNQFNDIVAAIALYRPGPMENIPLYLERRASKGKIDYPLVELEKILESTYGIMIYQEQIMLVAQNIAGFSLGKADILRKAMSKKEGTLMHSLKDDFIKGCIKNGYSENKGIEIFELIEKFANYGFNKSHSVAYAYIAYQLAYLKSNYPLYFFAAILSNDMSSENTKYHCLQECKSYGVTILPPSINHSYSRFVVENNHIRYSLLAIKNVGVAGYQAIVKERENGLFIDIFDFMKRMSTKLSKRVIESLINAGAFDEFGYSRETIHQNSDVIIDYGMLNETLGIEEKPILVHYADHEEKKLEREKDVLGIYLSKHPLELIKESLPSPVLSLNEATKGQHEQVHVLMQLSRVKIISDKNGNEMCFIEGIDESGSIEGVVFSSVFKQYGGLIKRGHVINVSGRIDRKDKVSLIVNQVKGVQ